MGTTPIILSAISRSRADSTISTTDTFRSRTFSTLPQDPTEECDSLLELAQNNHLSDMEINEQFTRLAKSLSESTSEDAGKSNLDSRDVSEDFREFNSTIHGLDKTNITSRPYLTGREQYLMDKDLDTNHVAIVTLLIVLFMMQIGVQYRTLAILVVTFLFYYYRLADDSKKGTLQGMFSFLPFAEAVGHVCGILKDDYIKDKEPFIDKLSSIDLATDWDEVGISELEGRSLDMYNKYVSVTKVVNAAFEKETLNRDKAEILRDLVSYISSPRPYVPICFNGVFDQAALLDSGASVSLISIDIIRHIEHLTNEIIPILPIQMEILQAGGSPMKIIGSCGLIFILGHREFFTIFHVAHSKSKSTIILGNNFLLEERLVFDIDTSGRVFLKDARKNELIEEASMIDGIMYSQQCMGA